MADPVISAKLIVLYRFLSHNFPRSKTMWFLANSSIWHRKMLLNLTIPHPTTCLNFFLWQFPSFSSCLEQRTVRNTTLWKTIIHFHYQKNEIFSPAVFNILKEPFIVQKKTLHQQKALDLSYLEPEGQGRGSVRWVPRPHAVKSKFRFLE